MFFGRVKTLPTHATVLGMRGEFKSITASANASQGCLFILAIVCQRMLLDGHNVTNVHMSAPGD